MYPRLAEMLASSLHTLLPFHLLSTMPDGATAAQSLVMPNNAVTRLKHNFGLLVHSREPASLLVGLLSLISAVVVPLSSEAIGIKQGAVATLTTFPGAT